MSLSRKIRPEIEKALEKQEPSLVKYLVGEMRRLTALMEEGMKVYNARYDQAMSVGPEFRNQPKDAAMLKGGIDFNSANLNLQIKRDGKGVPLPLIQQDMDQLMQIPGFVPVIIEIKPAAGLPIFSELQEKFQSASSSLMASAK